MEGEKTKTKNKHPRTQTHLTANKSPSTPSPTEVKEQKALFSAVWFGEALSVVRKPAGITKDDQEV